MSRSWMPLAAILLALSGAMLGANTVRAQAERVVRAERFELVDAQGKVRADLRVTDGGGVQLTLTDRFGSPGVIVVVDKDDSPGISLLDERGTMRALLGTRPNGTPVLGMFDRQNRTLAAMTCDRDEGGGGLLLCNRDGEKVWQAPYLTVAKA